MKDEADAQWLTIHTTHRGGIPPSPSAQYCSTMNYPKNSRPTLFNPTVKNLTLIRDANQGGLGRFLIMKCDELMRQEWHRLNAHQATLFGDEVVSAVMISHVGHLPTHGALVTKFERRFKSYHSGSEQDTSEPSAQSNGCTERERCEEG